MDIQGKCKAREVGEGGADSLLKGGVGEGGAEGDVGERDADGGGRLMHDYNKGPFFYYVSHFGAILDPLPPLSKQK